MQWKEASTFYKVVIVVGLLCAFAAFILAVIDIMGIWEDTDMISQPLWCVFCLSQGILYRKTRRQLAIFWFFLCGLYFLLSIVHLFI